MAQPYVLTDVNRKMAINLLFNGYATAICAYQQTASPAHK